MTDAPTEREGEGAWAKLRRRKVVQWGVAYVAGAWGLLQGLAYVATIFHWSDRLQQLATLSLFVGLPIAIVLAWYHGDRGQQRVSGSEFAILVGLLLLGGGIFWWHQRAADTAATASTTRQPASTSSIAAANDPRPSIAVLPFENRSAKQDDAFFVDGIHDDILTQLSKVSALKVISRTSVERYRNTELTTKVIADQLGVTKILEGGVQRAGDRVRVTVQLIDATSDAHVWAESYDRELSAANIFAIQSEVASAIAVALKASLTAGETERVAAIPTRNLDAWQAYQIGRQRMASRTKMGLSEAERQFRRAVALDPNFALAWTALADTLVMESAYGFRPQNAGLTEAEQALAPALRLDPDLAEAWASAGGIAQNRFQLPRAEQLLRKAIALNPNYAPAYQWLAAVLSDLGRRDAALITVEHAVALDPLSAIINNQLGLCRASVGRFDEAIAAFQQVIEIEPTMPYSYWNIGDMLAYGLGQVGNAIPWYKKTAIVHSDSGDPSSSVAEAYWELGDDAEAKRWLAQALQHRSWLYSDAAAAALTLSWGDAASARKHAQLAAAADPLYTFLVRDDLIRSRDYRGARALYLKTFPNLFAEPLPAFTDRETFAAVDLALVLQHTGEAQRATALLDRSEARLQNIPRMGPYLIGYGIADVAAYAIRGRTTLALQKLREAERAGWRRAWRYYRDFDPNLDSIRNEPEFKAIFADIERDMARQRAELAARPTGAPLSVEVAGT